MTWTARSLTARKRVSCACTTIRKSGRIVGGTIVARHAGEMIGELTLAIATQQKVGTFSSIVHPYPTQAEAIRKVGDTYMRGKLSPLVKKVFAKWFEWRR